MLGPRASSAYILDSRHFKVPFFFPRVIKRKLVGGPGSKPSTVKLLVQTGASFNRLDQLYTYQKGIDDPDKESSSNSSQLQTAQLQSGSGKSGKNKIQSSVLKNQEAEGRNREKQTEVLDKKHNDIEKSDLDDSDNEKSDTEPESEDDSDSTHDSSSDCNELTEDDIKQIFQHPVKISSVELKKLEAEGKQGSGIKRKVEDEKKIKSNTKQLAKKYKFCILPD